MNWFLKMLAIGLMAVVVTGCAGAKTNVAMVPLSELEAERELRIDREKKLQIAVYAANLWRVKARQLYDDMIEAMKKKK